MTENEMVGWHHLFDGHELEQTPGDREACSSWALKGSDMIEQLNNNQFLAVLGLHCHKQTCSSCSEQGLLCSCGAWASHRRLLLLWSMGSATRGLCSCGAWA